MVHPSAETSGLLTLPPLNSGRKDLPTLEEYLIRYVLFCLPFSGRSLNMTEILLTGH